MTTDQPSATNRNLCTATRRDGRPCTVVALRGSLYCFAHDPKQAADRSSARRAGGHNKASTARLRRLVPSGLNSVYDQLEQAMADVLAGKLDPARAQAAASLARAMVVIMTAGETEQRLRTVEEQLRKAGNG